MAKIYFDQDADLHHLNEKIVAIIGYGNQGRSQALNLRDSGIEVIVGNIQDESYTKAINDGFQVYSPAEAAEKAHFQFLLIPDEIIPKVFHSQIAPGLNEGDTLVFASGYNITFRLVEPPKDVDVIMLAPRMIGHGVREMYLNNEGFPSLIAVAQDASGLALPHCLALAKGIGSTRMGALLSSFEEETTIDLFTEQVGGAYAIRRFFEVLTDAGCDPEAVLLELYASGEMISTARAYRDMGLWGQMGTHSRTSQYGQEVTSKIPEEQEAKEKKRLREIVKNIQNGGFAHAWSAEQEKLFSEWNRVRQENLEHPMIKAEDELYKKLGRRKE